MCGIAGFVGNVLDKEKIINKMLDQMVNRGPDACGVWMDEHSEVVLGHRRLSIRDLSNAGSQPMISKNGRWIITYNGEIYNTKQIIDKVESLGNKMHLIGSSDTEVLVEAISYMGITNTLKLCKGMFGATLFDREEKKLYLFRDRFGEKPLYYGMVNGVFAFASDILCIEQIPGWKREIDKSILPFYFSHGYIPDKKSIYSNIHKVGAGEIVEYEIKTGSVNVIKYWSLIESAIQGKMESFSGSFEEAAEELESLLISSIKSQLASDVPVGVCLSGGIDSTLITALLQKNVSNSIDTFTIGVENSNLDEALMAKEISKRLGTNHHEEYITEREMMDVIPKLSSIYSEPFADSSQIPTFLVSKMAKKSVTVLLSGDAGDEFFCGYPTFWECEALFNKISNIPYFLRKIGGATIKNTIGKANFLAYKAGNRIMSKSPADLMMKRKFTSYGQEKLIGVSYIEEYGKYDEIWNMESIDNLTKLMLISASIYLSDDILTKVDRAGMAVSLENRIPFLDKDVVEFALRLPINYKYDGNSKRILRNILYKYIPKDVMEKPKMGFSIPIDSWILKDKNLKDWAESLIFENNSKDEYYNSIYVKKMWREYTEKHNWNQCLWHVLMFEAWNGQNDVAD